MHTATKSKRRIVGRGLVLLISSLLLGSGLIRIGTGTAVAQEDIVKNIPTDLSQVSDSEIANYFDVVLKALQSREDRVEERELAADARARAIEQAKMKIEQKLGELKAAEDRLLSTLAYAQTASEDDLARLTVVYENMKPKDAAEIFQTMEPNFSAGFLARMRPDLAAKIMSGLDPQTAYSISAVLAGRNANALNE